MSNGRGDRSALRHLPYWSSRVVRGTYVLTAGVGLVCAAWLAVTLVGYATTRDEFFRLAGLLWLAIVVPTTLFAFPAGSLVWRAFAPDRPSARAGAVLGGATSAVALLVGAALGGAVAGAVLWHVGPYDGSVQSVLDLAAGGVVIGPIVGVPTVGWLVVPVGIATGWYYERSIAPDPGRDAELRAVR